MQIWDLFDGYEGAHGRYEVKRVNDKGKNEGRAATVRETVTQAHWDKHLAGTGAGLGIIPLKRDNTVKWGVIDVDEYAGMKHDAVEAKCRSMGLPLVICRSKSGGAHCFLFLRKPLDAGLVINTLTTWAARLGYGGAEVFPKQSMRYDEENDIGNWLNMPYFHADRTSRYCIHNGKELDLAEFLEYAESMLQDEDDIVAASEKSLPGKEVDNVLFEEGPPCLQLIHAQGGFPDGTRNDGMYNVAVYLRKRFPDDWQDKLQTYNVEMCDPPLPLQDINNTAKSVQKKAYEYRCRKPPIAPFCDRRTCLRRQCGVGETSDGGGRPEILDVKKFKGSPVIWFMTVNGQRMQMGTDELLNQGAFTKHLVDAISVAPNQMPPPRWIRFINDLIANAEVEEAPIDATPVGQFNTVLDSYLLGQAKTTTKEQLADSNSPFNAGDGTVWFKLRGLIRYLDTQGHKIKSETHLASMLKDLGAYNKEVSVKGKSFRVWIISEPDSSKEPDPEPSFGTQDF